MKCHLKAKSSNPPLAERLKDDLLGLDTVRSYRNGSNITLWTTYSTKPSSTVTTSYSTAPNEIIQERLKHNSLDHLQHQAKQYRNDLIQLCLSRPCIILGGVVSDGWVGWFVCLLIGLRDPTAFAI